MDLTLDLSDAGEAQMLDPVSRSMIKSPLTGQLTCDSSWADV